MSDESVSLKEYFERILQEKDRALSAALAAAKEAVQVAENNAEKWRASANEWRGTMSDKDRLFVSRSEFTTFIDGVEKDLKVLNTFKDNLQGIATQKEVGNARLVGYIGIGIGLMGAAIGTFGLFLRLLGK